MYIHQSNPQMLSQSTSITMSNTTIVIAPAKQLSEIDIINVDGNGVQPLIVTGVMLVLALVVICIWNGYHIWKRGRSSSRNYTFTSTDPYSDVWSFDEEVGVGSGVFSDMVNDLPVITEDIELENFGGGSQ
ncbi:uncharacterized protein LY89DRAFT_667789 [Mollisia scopiformis]|uniref:Uncharacterized protein n=1 Tax=Mollisia scopiformis TaxID=149040 RepID=A0A194XEZ5_MOLSC|nr:uncharacterized protein LY89DRAFT_667789 [Mollisia scopiformis]KUJ18721.1 hypothetical protein LY89DRAFT_667789 [Mollisia scopiformis]